MNALFKPTHIHSKLDGSWLYLHEQMPPQKWAALPSFGTAATWLGMHHSLRRGQGELDYLSREYQQGRLRWPDFTLAEQQTSGGGSDPAAVFVCGTRDVSRVACGRRSW